MKASASVVVLGAASPCLGTLQNISRSGARVSVPRASSAALASVPAGTPLSLLLQLGAQSFKQVAAQVVAADGGGLSLEFDEVLDGTLFEHLTLRNLVLAASRP